MKGRLNLILITGFVIFTISFAFTIASRKFLPPKKPTTIPHLAPVYKTLKAVDLIVSPFISMGVVIFLATTFYRDHLRQKTDPQIAVPKIIRLQKFIYPFNISMIIFIVIEVVFDYAKLFTLRPLHFTDFLSFGYLSGIGVLIMFIAFYMYERGFSDYIKTSDVPQLTTDFHLAHAGKYETKENFEKARAHYQKACDSAPHPIYPLSLFAFFCEAELENSTLADQYIEKASDIISSQEATEDELVHFYSNLGSIMYCRGKSDLAIKYLQNAIKLDSKAVMVEIHKKIIAKIKEFPDIEQYE